MLTGFMVVKKETDSKKPVNAKTSETKVDRQRSARIDPMLNDEEHLLVGRKAEDELKNKWDRDARTLRASPRLDNAKGQPLRVSSVGRSGGALTPATGAVIPNARKTVIWRGRQGFALRSMIAK